MTRTRRILASRDFANIYEIKKTPRLRITICGSQKALSYVGFETITFSAVERGVATTKYDTITYSL